MHTMRPPRSREPSTLLRAHKRVVRFTLLLAAAVWVVPATLTSPLPLSSSSPGGTAFLVGAETSGTVEADRAALMAFYAVANGPNWGSETNWGSDEPLGSWQGVTTDEDGRVIGLRLDGRYGLGETLKGALPPALGNLDKLQTLVLSNSQLGGPIPAELGNLTNLQSLILFNSEFSGPIPASLGDLEELQGLVLSLNELSGRIPSELANLASLEVLGLANNKLSGAIPAGLANLASLQALYLAANQLSGPIPPSLGNLSNLQFMRLAGNPELTGCVPRNLRRLLVSPVSGRVTHDFIEVDGNRDGSLDDALRGDVAGLGLPFCMLRNLQLGGATLDPPFVAENLDLCQASLHNGATAVVVTATLMDEHARVGIRKGGRSYANGEPVPLDPGLNTITIDIAPLDATPWQTFSVEVTRPPGPISWPLREGSDIVAAPPGVSTTASRLFRGTDVELAFKYNRATRGWDDFYFTALDLGGFEVEPADILWVLAKQSLTLNFDGRPAAGPPPPGEIELMLHGGGDMVVVPAGSPTTAARLFAGTDVEAVWKYNRRTRAWDLGYRPAHDGGAGFPVEPGDILWVVAERDLVVGGKAPPEAREPRLADPAVEVSVSQGHSCVLRESGAVVCWGANDRGQVDVPPGRYRSVSAGWSHTCALRESGEIACWGSNRER